MGTVQVDKLVNETWYRGQIERWITNVLFTIAHHPPSPFSSFASHHLPRRGHRFHRILNGAARTRLAIIALRLLSSTGVFARISFPARVRDPPPFPVPRRVPPLSDAILTRSRARRCIELRDQPELGIGELVRLRNT